jgi:Arabinose-binding domain of AraC transcription regulator, N-term
MSTSRQATMSGVAVLDLLKALRRVRVQPAPLCRVLGLNVTSLEDPDARVSTALVTRLLALAEHRARDPWVGLHAGEYAEPRGPLFYMMLSSPRVVEGLRRAQRFSGLALGTLRLNARSERSRA